MDHRPLAAAVCLRQEGQNALSEGGQLGQELVGDRSIPDAVAPEVRSIPSEQVIVVLELFGHEQADDTPDTVPSHKL
jgi:hypothetical protein